jgi:mono/diheme cytochrome c family protein
MSQGRHIAGFVGAVLLAAATAVSAAEPAPAARPTAGHGAGGAPSWAFFEKYCVECHNATDWAGGFAYDTMTPDIAENAELMEKTVRKLRGQLMPPGGHEQPPAADARAFIKWIESDLDKAGAARVEPGHVGMHRLNRKEYANAVRDLLSVNIDPTAMLPRDDIREGFDNIAAALQVSPAFVDQYVSAARQVSVLAVGNRHALPGGAVYRPAAASTQYFHQDGLPLGTRGGFAVDHYFPADGDYELSVANMAQALWVYNMEFENTLVIALDGAPVYEVTIGGEEDMKAIDQKQDPAVDAINKRLKNIRFQAKAGTHRIAVAFRQRSFAESEDRLQQYIPGGGQDRILRVASFDVRGPYNITGISAFPSRDRVFTCYPKSAAEEQPCAEKILSTLARRAFRRPLEAGDTAGLLKIYQAGRQGGDFEDGVRRGIAAILAHPAFLYRTDVPAEPLQAKDVFQISDLSLASRLSFFLWSSLPDDELIDVAARGQLRDPKVLEQQVRRMIADKRADSLATSFGYQWLNVAKLAELDLDPAVYPYAAGAGDLREDFRTEIKLFLTTIFREDRSVLDLLASDQTWVNERLALHYEIPGIRGNQFRRVTLQNPVRFGLLGKGATLMASSYPNRTSPVVRGNYIMERITGTPPATPPANVTPLPETKAGEKALTVKERAAAHSVAPQCHSCHAILDPLGFALENFDSTGKYRTVDRFAHTPIDTAAKLPDGRPLNGPLELRKWLLETPDQFVQNFTEKLMTYALGRTLEYRDMPVVRGIVHETARNDYRFVTLVMNIVNSDAFQKSQLPPEKELPATKTAFVQP